MEKILRSRILERFPFDLRVELDLLSRRRDIINAEKQSEIFKLLRKYKISGMVPLGSGTNRYAFKLDGYVIKVATDNDGKIDNLKEFKMAKRLYPYVTRIHEVSTNGTLLVAEYIQPFSSYAEMLQHADQIRAILQKLSSVYLIGDVGITMKNYANWGLRIGYDDPVCLDFAYVYEVSSKLFVCQQCHTGAMLIPNKDFTELYCSNPNCGKKFNFEEIRRRIGNDMHNQEIGDLTEEGYQMEESGRRITLTPSRSYYIKKDTPSTKKIENKEDQTMNVYEMSQRIMNQRKEPQKAFEVTVRKTNHPLKSDPNVRVYKQEDEDMVMDLNDDDIERIIMTAKEEMDREDSMEDQDEPEIDEEEEEEEIEEESEEEPDDEEIEDFYKDDKDEISYHSELAFEQKVDNLGVVKAMKVEDAPEELQNSDDHVVIQIPDPEKVEEEDVEEPEKTQPVQEEEVHVEKHNFHPDFEHRIHRNVSNFSNRIGDFLKNIKIMEKIPTKDITDSNLTADAFYTAVQNAVFKSLVSFLKFNVKMEPTKDGNGTRKYYTTPDNIRDPETINTMIFLDQYWRQFDIREYHGPVQKTMAVYDKKYPTSPINGIQTSWLKSLDERMQMKMPYLTAAGRQIIENAIEDIWCQGRGARRLKKDYVEQEKKVTPNPVKEEPVVEESVIEVDPAEVKDHVEEEVDPMPTSKLAFEQSYEDEKPEEEVEEVEAEEVVTPEADVSDEDQEVEDMEEDILNQFYDDDDLPTPINIQITHDEFGDIIHVVTEDEYDDIRVPLYCDLSTVNTESQVDSIADNRNADYDFMINFAPDITFYTKDPERWLAYNKNDAQMKFVILDDDHHVNYLMGMYIFTGIFIYDDERSDFVPCDPKEYPILLAKVNRVIREDTMYARISHLPRTISNTSTLTNEKDMIDFVMNAAPVHQQETEHGFYSDEEEEAFKQLISMGLVGTDDENQENPYLKPVDGEVEEEEAVPEATSEVAEEAPAVEEEVAEEPEVEEEVAVAKKEPDGDTLKMVTPKPNVLPTFRRPTQKESMIQ